MYDVHKWMTSVVSLLRTPRVVCQHELTHARKSRTAYPPLNIYTYGYGKVMCSMAMFCLAEQHTLADHLSRCSTFMYCVYVFECVCVAVTQQIYINTKNAHEAILNRAGRLFCVYVCVYRHGVGGTSIAWVYARVMGVGFQSTAQRGEFTST